MRDHAGFRTQLGTLAHKPLRRRIRRRGGVGRPKNVFIVGFAPGFSSWTLILENCRPRHPFNRFRCITMDEPAFTPRLELDGIDVEEALASYVTFHLDATGEDGRRHTSIRHAGRTELISQLCRALERPAPAMESFRNRVIAHSAGHGKTRLVQMADQVMRKEFLADRVFVRSCFAFSDEEWKEVDHDLIRLGGFVRAAFRAARHVRAATAEWIQVKTIAGEWDEAEWSTWLARTCRIVVRVHPSRDLSACLVRTPAQRVIWLSEDLPDESRPLAILHELAHWLLDHRPNTEYGLNPDRLTDFGRAEFQRQEREADAYARLLRSSLESLKEVASTEPAREKEPPRRHVAPERSAA